MLLPAPLLDVWADPILDLLFGSECAGCGHAGRLLCRRCRAALPVDGRRIPPTALPADLVPAYAVAPYDGTLRRLLVHHKERGAFGLARVLGPGLAGAVGAALPLAATAPPPRPAVVLVPVPSRTAAVRERGHDHMLRLVRATAGRLRAAGWEASALPLLTVRGAVADQAGLSGTERLANVADRFAVRSGARAALVRRRGPVAVVLCDDIVTTGATAREGQRALAAAGVGPVAVAALAWTPTRGTKVTDPHPRLPKPRPPG